MNHIQKNPVSGRLRSFIDSIKTDKITIRQIAESFQDREYALLSLMFALIAAIPIPGSHAILGLPILLVSAQRFAGVKKIWLPEIVMKQEISSTTFTGLVKKSLPYIEKTECFCKPRMQKIITAHGIWGFALVATLLSLIIVVPGPLTNFVPAVSIAVIAIGILMDDGLIALSGAIIGIIFSIFLTVLYLGALLIFLHAASAWFTS